MKTNYALSLIVMIVALVLFNSFLNIALFYDLGVTILTSLFLILTTLILVVGVILLIGIK